MTSNLLINEPNILTEPVQYCRLCFMSSKRQLTALTEETRDNFHEITNLQLIKSETYSNLICSVCEKKLNDTRIYRDELIKNEQRLMDQQVDEFSFVDPLRPIVQLKIKPELAENYEKQSRLIKEMFESDSSDNEEEEWKALKRRKSSDKRRRRNRIKRRGTSLKPGPKRCYENPDLDKEIESLPETDDGKVDCSQCSKPILKIYYRQHMERIHLNIKNYTCDRCGRKFYGYNALDEHMNQHLNLQPFPCPYKCGRWFSNKTSRKTHVKHAHSIDYEYFCEFCAMKFKERYSLKSHISIKHQGFRYKCTYEGCKKEYETDGGLLLHISTVHDFRMETCEVCGLTLKSGDMYRHKRLKHSEMKFACSFCHRRFATAALRKNHEKTHTGQKDFICKICNSKFFMRWNLTRHVRSQHQKSKFYCKIPGCGSVLSTKDNYRTHIKTVHKSLPDLQREQLLKETTTMKPDYIQEAEEASAEEN